MARHRRWSGRSAAALVGTLPRTCADQRLTSGCTGRDRTLIAANLSQFLAPVNSIVMPQTPRRPCRKTPRRTRRTSPPGDALGAPARFLDSRKDSTVAEVLLEPRQINAQGHSHTFIWMGFHAGGGSRGGNIALPPTMLAVLIALQAPGEPEHRGAERAARGSDIRSTQGRRL
jgi:hypothetical protein